MMTSRKDNNKPKGVLQHKIKQKMKIYFTKNKILLIHFKGSLF